MSAHNPKVDDAKATEARLREGAVAKALLERMTEAAVMRINEISQDEMKQWGQVLKDSKANPEAPPSRSWTLRLKSCWQVTRQCA